MQRVHHGQQEFADPFRPAEIHDVGLIVREFCQTIELFWPGVNVESDSLGSLRKARLKPGISIAPWIALIGG